MENYNIDYLSNDELTSISGSGEETVFDENFDNDSLTSVQQSEQAAIGTEFSGSSDSEYSSEGNTDYLLGQIEVKIEHLNYRIDYLKDIVNINREDFNKSLNDRIIGTEKEINTRTEYVNNRIDNVESELHKTYLKIFNLENKVSSLERENSEMKTRMLNLEKAVSLLQNQK